MFDQQHLLRKNGRKYQNQFIAKRKQSPTEESEKEEKIALKWMLPVASSSEVSLCQQIGKKKSPETPDFGVDLDLASNESSEQSEMINQTNEVPMQFKTQKVYMSARTLNKDNVRLIMTDSVMKEKMTLIEPKQSINRNLRINK